MNVLKLLKKVKPAIITLAENENSYKCSSCTTYTVLCELYHYQFFKDVGFKFQKHVGSGCHDLLTMAYSLKNIAKLSAKGATFRSVLMGISKNEDLKRLNNSVTYDSGVLQM